MNTSRKTSDFDFREVITQGDLAYNRARLRNRVYECVYNALSERHERSGLTRADIAARLGKDRAQITRWLSGPNNWTLDTVSDLLSAASAEIRLACELLEDCVPSNYVHPLALPPSQVREEEGPWIMQHRMKSGSFTANDGKAIGLRALKESRNPEVSKSERSSNTIAINR